MIVVIGNAALGAPVLQGGSWIRGRNIGGKAIRLQMHTLGHMRAPACQGRAEGSEFTSGRSQMGGERQAIGPRSDDRCFHHFPPPALCQPVPNWDALVLWLRERNSAIFTDG